MKPKEVKVEAGLMKTYPIFSCCGINWFMILSVSFVSAPFCTYHFVHTILSLTFSIRTGFILITFCPYRTRIELIFTCVILQNCSCLIVIQIGLLSKSARLKERMFKERKWRGVLHLMEAGMI